MIQDVGLPIQHPQNDRDEIFVVYFDGFIKNTSAGIIRTMMRDIDDWIGKYPMLNIFEGMTRDELYESTMLTMPLELLYELSDEKLTLEEIQEDLSKILPNIILSNSHYTTFELALYQLLKEDHIKKCYIFRDSEFYDNEIQYIERMYKDVLDKIEIMNGGFLTLFNEVHPTSCFITDYHIVSDYMVDNYTSEELDKTLFVILNTFYNVYFNEETKVYEYREDFANLMDDYTKNQSFGMTAMFNFQLDSQAAEDKISQAKTGEPVYYPTAEEVDEEIRLLEGEK